MVLFETPSGFAIFYADGISLYEPDAMEVRALFFFLASLLMCFVTFFLLALVVVDLPFLDQSHTESPRSTSQHELFYFYWMRHLSQTLFNLSLLEAREVLLNKLLLTAADSSSELVVTAAKAHPLAAGSIDAAVTRDEFAVAVASAPIEVRRCPVPSTRFLTLLRNRALGCPRGARLQGKSRQCRRPQELVLELGGARRGLVPRVSAGVFVGAGTSLT